jgi:hypothetical protein
MRDLCSEVHLQDVRRGWNAGQTGIARFSRFFACILASGIKENPEFLLECFGRWITINMEL